MQSAVLNNTLWQSILGFNFDDADGDYCFSVRLAQEQGWTTHFTEQAILEYRRFMYLAATENFMVSPSAIVDEVWHLHLLFTTSYQQFCRLLGKEIAHIPSTHSKAEGVKFKVAKEQTVVSYERVFGAMPAAIWEYGTMADSLGLKKARSPLNRLVKTSIVVFALLLPIAFWVLRPVYAHLNNPYFLFGYLALVILAFRMLQRTNRRLFQRMVAQFPKDSFPFHFTPAEGIFLKTGKLSDVVDNVVNGLFQKEAVAVVGDRTLKSESTNIPLTPEEGIVTVLLEEQGQTDYTALRRQLLAKPIFENARNGGNILQKAIAESSEFTTIFTLNFWVLGIVLLLGLTRVATGIARDKPILLILITMIIVLLVIVGYLVQLPKFANTVTLTDQYREKLTSELAPAAWSYFLLGAAALSLSFAPVAQTAGYKGSGSSDSGGGSCGSDSGGGSSCGSSCGSGCGGCGGGD